MEENFAEENSCGFLEAKEEESLSAGVYAV